MKYLHSTRLLPTTHILNTYANDSMRLVLKDFYLVLAKKHIYISWIFFGALFVSEIIICILFQPKCALNLHLFAPKILSIGCFLGALMLILLNESVPNRTIRGCNSSTYFFNYVNLMQIWCKLL